MCCFGPGLEPTELVLIVCGRAVVAFGFAFVFVLATGFAAVPGVVRSYRAKKNRF